MRTLLLAILLPGIVLNCAAGQNSAPASPEPQPQAAVPQMLEFAWSAAPPMPQGMQDNNISMIHGWMVSVAGFCGGYDDDWKPGKYPRGFLNKAWGLDLANEANGWAELPPMPGAPRQAMVGARANDALYVWGGFSYSAPYTYQDGYKLSRTDAGWAWEELPPLPSAVAWAGCCSIGSKIYCLGGCDYDSTNFYSLTDRAGKIERLGARFTVIDTNNLQAGWQTLTSCPGTPRGFPATGVVDGKLYFVGGFAVTPAGEYCNVVDSWRYDPAANAWERLRDLPISGSGTSAGLIVYKDRYLLLPCGYQYQNIMKPDGSLAPKYGEPSTVGATWENHPKLKDTHYYNHCFVYDTRTNLYGTATYLPFDDVATITVILGDTSYMFPGETAGFKWNGEYFGHHPEFVLKGAIKELDWNKDAAAGNVPPTDPSLKTIHFARKDGGEGALVYPATAKPLQSFVCQIQNAGEGIYELADNARPNSSIAFSPDGKLERILAGAEGDRSFTLLRDGAAVGSFSIRLAVETDWQADRFSPLFQTLCKQVRGDRSVWKRDGRTIEANPTWVRDHIHEMKGYQYWEKDITSFVDELIALQHPDGFYYEIIGPATHDHQAFVNPKHFLREDDKDLCWIRLEMEADVEYLIVEAAHRIWQATGDFDAMKRRLPSLERALEYDFTDPTRWDAEHGALKRTFSIDTWDFTYGISDRNRKIEPGLPMGIMHGDNSGLYRACLQLADMLHAAGNDERAEFWRKRGEDLRERINKLCFNGTFYTHQILLQPVDTGVREEDILSLSDAYDINRGLPTHEMAVKIIDEYQRRRETMRETYFAEWFSINPPYPKFGPYAADCYINGGVCGFVAGELAKAAFQHGRESYAADILGRVDEKVAQDGAIRFHYDRTGKDIGGGPAGWSAAAVLSALIEGLAGIHDDTTLFQTVTVSPRFSVAGISHACVTAKYGPSGAYVTMNYRRDGNRITLGLCGSADLYHVKILLPEGVKVATALDAAADAVFTGIETIEESHYFTMDLPAWHKTAQGVACIIAF